MTPVISIVGKSKSGKTTLIEKLVPELKRRGYKVGTIKHDVHGFQLDREGKDTWRHAQAGVDTVVISSPQKAACIKKVNEELAIDELICQFLPDVKCQKYPQPARMTCWLSSFRKTSDLG